MTSRWTRPRTWTKSAFLLCVLEALREGHSAEATLRAQARTDRQESPAPHEPVSLLPVGRVTDACNGHQHVVKVTWCKGHMVQMALCKDQSVQATLDFLLFRGETTGDVHTSMGRGPCCTPSVWVLALRFRGSNGSNGQEPPSSSGCPHTQLS